ncbi:hypothetical protein ACFXKG_30900 [Streptomyces sp. NPDC059255]|uniref:hypothetical protein n=1 Tax=Streptomyces sp. NPDC059255 TaxID=3346793 RepID=UPI0036A9DB25
MTAMKWETAATTIIHGCGWTEARLMGGAMSEQTRIVHEPAGRWLGVTGSFLHGGVSLHAGFIQPDGTYGDAVVSYTEGGSASIWFAADDRLVAAAHQLWQQLDNTEHP